MAGHIDHTGLDKCKGYVEENWHENPIKPAPEERGNKATHRPWVPLYGPQ